ncbi:MAG: protein translocase subunit SecD [Hyphomicrobiaceae bacterium]
MLYVSPWKSLAVLATCLIGVLLAVPSFLSKATVQSWPSWIPKKQMSLGLDLQGGAHLLLAMDTDGLLKSWLNNLRLDARKELLDVKIAFAPPAIVGNAVQVRISRPEDSDAALRALRRLVQPIGNPLLGTSGNDLDVEKGDGGIVTLRPTSQGLQARVSNAASASIETVRRRVDFAGTTEPIIQRQGSDRILVQVPGIQDTVLLKTILGQTAKLSFHAVHLDYQGPLGEEEQRTLRVPSGYRVFLPASAGEGAYLLQEVPVVEGSDLTNALQAFDQQTNEPIISFTFNTAGARKFGRYTQENVGKLFAIVLDDKVLSAPVIREQILTGSGQISGSFTVESANTLAVQLRSGSLPTKLTIVEERTVGPSLGADSIAAGKLATLIGFVGVAIFMTIGYGLFGFFAIIALVVNIAFIFSALSLLEATLTLPGIAGIVLTMGMSVDANVLINERIRDELRIGRSPIAALDAGFTRAYGTILDTNMTGLLAALILIWFGSGPVRGFGVTMAIGIVASAFTATTVTRYFVAGWLRSTRPTAVPI